MASHLVKELQEFYVRVDSQSGELHFKLSSPYINYINPIGNTGKLHTLQMTILSLL